MMSLQQLTLRGFDPELELRLRRLAQEKAISLNKAALFLMRLGAGLKMSGQPIVVGSSLDHLMGLWSEEDAAEFHEAASGFDTIDEELWT